MSNKQVIAVFIICIALLLGAFWAGMRVVKQDGGASPSPAETSNRNAHAAKPKPVGDEGASAETRYIVRVATYGTASEANKLTEELRRKYISAHTQTPGGEDTLYRVNIGPYNRREDAQQVMNELASEGRKGVIIAPTKEDTK